MKKSFESVLSNTQLEVFDSDGLIYLQVRGHKGALSGVHLDADTAPNLALAELEAAEVETNESMHYGQLGSADHLGAIKYDLMRYIEHRDANAAAEADRVKLEAEALKLLLAFQAIDDPDNRGCEWRQYGSETKDKWLAVARAARELNKEAGQ